MPRARRRSDGQDGRGGPRVGVQGESYPNRSDLQQAPRQPVRTATGQPYGQAVAQQRAQQAMPLPATPPVPQPQGPPAPSVWADDVPNLFAPSRRPDEPITAGLPFGPGAGPLMDAVPAPNPTADLIRGLYLRYPTPELRELITELDLEM